MMQPVDYEPTPKTSDGKRFHNFSAGPAALPWPVRERIAEEFSLPADHAPSVAEISHRGPRFKDIAERLEDAESLLAWVRPAHEAALRAVAANRRKKRR